MGWATASFPLATLISQPLGDEWPLLVQFSALLLLQCHCMCSFGVYLFIFIKQQDSTLKTSLGGYVIFGNTEQTELSLGEVRFYLVHFKGYL